MLGDPKAKVELIEYGDLQCPVCKAYSEEFLPQIIEGQVKEGKAKLDFRNFTIIGDQSAPAGAAALAAGAQGRGWEYLELFYRNQGKENSGYADDEFLTAVAKGAGVKDIAKWNKDRKGTEVHRRGHGDDRRSPEHSASPARRRSRSKARAPTASNSSARPARPRKSKRRSKKPAELPGRGGQAHRAAVAPIRRLSLRVYITTIIVR